MPQYVQGGVTVRSNRELSPEEIQNALQQYRSGAVSAGHRQTTTQMEQFQDKPIEPAYNPLEDIATLGVGTAAGAGVGGLLGKLLSRVGFKGLTQDVVQAAGDALPLRFARPTTLDALSDVLRQTGQGQMSVAREGGLQALYRELNATRAQAQQAAAQGMTGQYAQAAANAVPDQAAKFKGLVNELAEANAGIINPTTGGAKPGAGTLSAIRDKEAIYQDIQQTLSPKQWQQFQAMQAEYNQFKDLQRLFAPARSGSKDVMQSRQLLQERAKGMQRDVDPDLLDTLFRGQGYVKTDQPLGIKLPLKIANLGVEIPGLALKNVGSPAVTRAGAIVGGTGGAGVTAYLRGLLDSGLPEVNPKPVDQDDDSTDNPNRKR